MYIYLKHFEKCCIKTCHVTSFTVWFPINMIKEWLPLQEAITHTTCETCYMEYLIHRSTSSTFPHNLFPTFATSSCRHGYAKNPHNNNITRQHKRALRWLNCVFVCSKMQYEPKQTWLFLSEFINKSVNSSISDSFDELVITLSGVSERLMSKEFFEPRIPPLSWESDLGMIGSYKLSTVELACFKQASCIQLHNEI